MNTNHTTTVQSTIETEIFRVPVYQGLSRNKLKRWLHEHSSVTNSTAYLAAYMITEHYYTTDWLAFPSNVSIAESLRLHRASVSRALEVLRESGEWVIVPGHSGKRSATGVSLPKTLNSLYFPVLPEDNLPDGVRFLGWATVSLDRRRENVVAGAFDEVPPPGDEDAPTHEPHPAY